MSIVRFSLYPSIFFCSFSAFLLVRISPRQSREPSSAPSPSLPPPPPSPSQPDLQIDLDLDLPPSPPPIESTLAALRARRQAILAKYAGGASVGASPSPGPSSAVPPPQAPSFLSNPVSQTHSTIGTPGITSQIDIKKAENGVSCQLFVDHVDYADHMLPIGKRESMSTSPTPEDFTLAKDDEQDVQVKVQAQNGGAEQISAADYDPSQDRREDEQRRVRITKDDVLPEVIEEEEEADIDDMFAVATGDRKKVRKVRKIAVGIISVEVTSYTNL